MTDGRSAILAHHGLADGDRLGQGTEAEVYRLDPRRVLKIFGAHVNPLTIESRRAFCAGLDASRVGFAVPCVFEAAQTRGTHHTIEARIAGSSLGEALPRLIGAARRDALLAYAEASTRVAEIGIPPGRFGELVAVPPLMADSWADFVAARAEAELRRNGGRLAGTVDRPERALARLEGWLARRPAAEPRLVHGDYYPPNVMVDDAGRVTGIVDFGNLALRGDPRLDPACALLSLENFDGVTAEDRGIVAGHLRGRGLCDDEDLRVYALFYAFRFLDTEREVLFRWCARTIGAAC